MDLEREKLERVDRKLFGASRHSCDTERHRSFCCGPQRWAIPLQNGRSGPGVSRLKRPALGFVVLGARFRAEPRSMEVADLRS